MDEKLPSLGPVCYLGNRAHEYPPLGAVVKTNRDMPSTTQIPH